MQGYSTFQNRAQHAAAELNRARTALCRAMLKVQALERESLKQDDAYRRLLPAGLGTTLLHVVITNWCACTTHA